MEAEGDRQTILKGRLAAGLAHAVDLQKPGVDLSDEGHIHRAPKHFLGETKHFLAEREPNPMAKNAVLCSSGPKHFRAAAPIFPAWKTNTSLAASPASAAR